jgi:hypothetical protein
MPTPTCPGIQHPPVVQIGDASTLQLALNGGFLIYIQHHHLQQHQRSFSSQLFTRATDVVVTDELLLQALGPP